MHYHCVFFFFQAEDGIRDVAVTEVQTCALPISALAGIVGALHLFDFELAFEWIGPGRRGGSHFGLVDSRAVLAALVAGVEIGRASCRERVEVLVVYASVNVKNSQVSDDKRVKGW